MFVQLIFDIGFRRSPNM